MTEAPDQNFPTSPADVPQSHLTAVLAILGPNSVHSPAAAPKSWHTDLPSALQMASKAVPLIPLRGLGRKALATASLSPHLLHVAGEDYSVTSDLTSSRERTSQVKARSLQLQICWLGWWHSAGYLLGWHHNPSVLSPPPQSCSLGLNETGKRCCWPHCRKMAAAVPPTYMTKYWNFWDLWSLLCISSSISPFLLGKQLAAVTVSFSLRDYITWCSSWFCLRR